MTGLELTQTMDWDGADVRWDSFGSGPPVVLCHGTPFSSYIWRSTVETLSPRRTVYVWDMIGYGQSDKPENVSLETQGKLLRALVDHWDLSAVDVVAHDLGGTVALRAHLLHSMPVRSFVLADVVALAPWGTPFFRLVGEHVEVFNQLPPNLHRALVWEYISGASSQGLPTEVHEQLVTPWLGVEGQPAFYRQMAQGDQRFTDEIEPLYPGIDVPTLLLWGAEDDWLAPSYGFRLQEFIPGSQCELIGGAGHLVQEDRPLELNTRITDWLDGDD